MDKAIIFLKSHSTAAASLDIVIVRIEDNIKMLENQENEDMNGWKRIRRNTPAVTNVEEWTRAETGVGAAIAAGSHLEKGIWALFVRDAIIINNNIRENEGVFIKEGIYQWPCEHIKAILNKISASPIRLVRTVIIPALKELGFW